VVIDLPLSVDIVQTVKSATTDGSRRSIANRYDVVDTVKADKQPISTEEKVRAGFSINREMYEFFLEPLTSYTLVTGDYILYNEEYYLVQDIVNYETLLVDGYDHLEVVTERMVIAPNA
jgi:hypothetical protein